MSVVTKYSHGFSVLAHLQVVEILIGEDRPPKLVLTGVNYAFLNPEKPVNYEG